MKEPLLPFLLLVAIAKSARHLVVGPVTLNWA
ncbi:membrane protein YqaA with SNARE-associated domain [Sinorhizobium medicae]